ncbi:MAG: insulinase family protein [Clostridia bacterium]|nr:insulinase family protein [Clostridia bacterium]
MTVTKQKVSDHLNLSCIQTDRFKTGVLTVTLTIPQTLHRSADSMLLSGILRRGTERYPTMAAINRRLDDLYASCVEIRTQRIGKNISLVFGAEMLDDRYAIDGTNITEGVIEVLSQMILHPRLPDGAFDPSLVAQEIRFTQDALRSEINNTKLYAAARLAELMHRDDPEYATVKQLQELLSHKDEHSLTAAYRDLLQNAVWQVFYVGTLSTDTIAEQIKKHFDFLPKTTPLPLLLPVAQESVGNCRASEQMPVAQGKLSLGFRTGVSAISNANEIYAAMMLNEIFGASPASKLFMNVREKMSLCYYCSSSYHRYSGIITLHSGIESKNRDIAEQAILAQMQEIRDGKISDAEFHAAKKSLENSYRQLYDNPFELQSFYGTRELFGLSETVEESCLALSRVTPEEIVSLANRVICDTVFFVEGIGGDTEDSDE